MDLDGGGGAGTRAECHDVEGLAGLGLVVLGLLGLLRLSVGVSGSAPICGDDG